MKSNKLKWVIGVLIILVFAFFAAHSFRSTLNPYVTLAEAARTERQVQVIGYIMTPETIGYNQTTGKLQFKLIDDEGSETLVIYGGAKPDNLEHAENVVVVGIYRNGIFEADKLLVKCPSKYEKDGEI